MYTSKSGERLESLKTFKSKDKAVKEAMKLKAEGNVAIFVDGQDDDFNTLDYQKI